MIVTEKDLECVVHVLLDTTCSVPLISKRLVDRKNIHCLRHEEPAPLVDFTGGVAKGSGKFYTTPLTIRHREHYMRENFEVATLDPYVDVILPFWWLAKHAPSGAWDSPQLCFNSLHCLEHCTKDAVAEFSLSLDESILQHSKARIIGYVSAVDTGAAPDLLGSVPKEFRQFLDIMGQEAADALSEHRSYNHRIDLKERENPTWGPIYPLSETELQALREWLKDMLRMGKIRESASSAGSPIFFVPKPNRRGLCLCVDY